MTKLAKQVRELQKKVIRKRTLPSNGIHQLSDGRIVERQGDIFYLMRVPKKEEYEKYHKLSDIELASLLKHTKQADITGETREDIYECLCYVPRSVVHVSWLTTSGDPTAKQLRKLLGSTLTPSTYNLHYYHRFYHGGSKT